MTDPPDADLAERVVDACRDDGQWARRVRDLGRVPGLRAEIRRAARRRGMPIRTALMGDTLVAVRLDAPIWSADVATMRRLLTAPEDADPI